MFLSPSNQLELIGHNVLFSTLKKLFDKNKLPNKILFSGQRGIGKSTLCYHLSNYILSSNEDMSYNHEKYIVSKENKSFKLINNNCHPNFYLINLKVEKNNIEISQIRDMISFTNKSSFDDGYKIIIIDNSEYLNTNSVNALLKTIEEPNDKVLFFLIHDIQKKIPDTLKSRCVQFKVSINRKTNENILNKILNNNFYNKLNDDFKHYYSTPGEYINLYNFFLLNDINFENITIEKFIKKIIENNSFKKDIYIKINILNFIELFFKKKIQNLKSKNKIFYMYKYFINKIDKVKKYNLDIEAFLIEFNAKLINE